MGVKCNIILPAALTRMAEGRDTTHYPPMVSEQVAPAVGWLVHESCTITGLIAMAGRIARAYIAETPGVYSDVWTIEHVAEEMDRIRFGGQPVVFPVVPDGFNDHLKFGFETARRGTRRS